MSYLDWHLDWHQAAIEPVDFFQVRSSSEVFQVRWTITGSSACALQHSGKRWMFAKPKHVIVREPECGTFVRSRETDRAYEGV